MRRAAAGERRPSGAQRFWWNLWLRRAAARDRCVGPGRASGAAADTLAEPPHGIRAASPRVPSLAGHPEASFQCGTRLDGPRPELFKSAAAELAIRRCPKRARGTFCGRGGRLDRASSTNFRFLRRGSTPELPALQGSSTSASH